MAELKTLEENISNISIDEVLESPVTIKDNKPSTSAVKTSHGDSVASSNEQNYDYQVGDIVWAKLGNYPLWPSIVCCDPDSNMYMKGSPKDRQKFLLHVRFYSDNGRRCWTRLAYHYFGKDDLLLKYPDCLKSKKYTKKQLKYWDLAVKEADSLLKFDRKERWIQFSNAYNIKSPVTTPIKSTSFSSVAVSNKLPENNFTTNTEDITDSVPDIKMRKIIKMKTAKKIVHPLNSLTFIYPEENYQIDDDDGYLVPTRPYRRKMLNRLVLDIERLEAEGINRMREKASKLAKSDSSE